MQRNQRTVATTMILGYVASSKPNKFYEIRRGNDGVMYCTCPAWAFAKNNNDTCKHMKGLMTGAIQMRAAAAAPAPQPTVAPAPAPRTAPRSRSARRAALAPVQPGPAPQAVTMSEVERINRALLAGTMSLTQSGIVTGTPEEDVL